MNMVQYNKTYAIIARPTVKVKKPLGRFTFDNKLYILLDNIINL